MNSITVAGNLGRDAEVRFLQNGDPVAGFSVADSQGKDKPTIWWSCSIFGKRAEALAPYLTKGQQVTVIGSVSERKWTDKDGNERTSMEIRVSEIALQGGRQQQEAAPQRPSKPQPTRTAKPQPQSSFDGDEDDIPF